MGYEEGLNDARRRAAETAEEETGGKKKVSQLFKNTMHKGHYEPEFTYTLEIQIQIVQKRMLHQLQHPLFVSE